MLFIDNINTLLGDEIKKSLRSKDKLKISASCFSIYAYEALRDELAQIDSLQFLFTSPTFTKDAISDSLPKTHREFFIPKINREKSLYGTELEIQLKNKLTQKAIAKECADWIRRKAIFKTNKTNASMQQFATIESNSSKESFFPIDGFTAVSLGYQQGNAISSFTHKYEQAEIAVTQNYINLFEQIWHDDEKLQDVTETICQQIENVYNQVEHIKADRGEEDLLFQVLLDWGVDLTLPIEKRVINGKNVFFVDQSVLVACFDKEIDEELIKAITQYQPLRAVFRDDGFINDTTKINAEQLFKQLAPHSELRVI